MRLLCHRISPAPPTLRAAAATRAWMDAFPGRHAYRCLPLSIANTFGWELLSPASFSIHWNGGPEADDIRFESHDGYAHLHHFVMSNFTRGIVTFHTGYLFRTEPGWNLMATGGFNRPKDGISPLTGIVETSWLPYPFTMNWQLTRPGRVRFETDEPFCLIVPVPAHALDDVQPLVYDLKGDSELGSQYFAWRGQREEFMASFRAGDPVTLKEAWQKFYFKGALPAAHVAADDHVQKLRLAEPVELGHSSIEVHAGMTSTAAPHALARQTEAG
jgi:hypothetical protein